eukprot:6702405-Ditylum_brightwellii.AAC.1
MAITQLMKLKESGDSNSHFKGANKHNTWQSNGSLSSMTYCCFGTVMTTTKTTTQAEITIAIAKAAVMPTKMVTVIDMTIMTRDAKETTVMMTGKKEIAIVLVTTASHIMWRKSTVALAPNLRATAAIAVALQVPAAFQAAADLVLVFCQTTAREVMTIA